MFRISFISFCLSIISFSGLAQSPNLNDTIKHAAAAAYFQSHKSEIFQQWKENHKKLKPRILKVKPSAVQLRISNRICVRSPFYLQEFFPAHGLTIEEPTYPPWDRKDIYFLGGSYIENFPGSFGDTSVPAAKDSTFFVSFGPARQNYLIGEISSDVNYSIICNMQYRLRYLQFLMVFDGDRVKAVHYVRVDH